MSSLTTGLICTTCSFGGALFGMWLSTLLPNHHLRGNSKDNVMQDFQGKLRALTPQNDSQRLLLAKAMQLGDEIAQTRWLLIEQEQSALPTAPLAVLLFWLTMLHLSIGLFAERNATVIIVMFVCAVSVSAAIFVILEMNHPLEGVIQVSGAPMRKALELIGH